MARFAARFKSAGFTVAPETYELMREIVASGELEALRPERVWQETSKALQEDRPDVYFEVLRECAALARVFPEIDALFGVPQPERWHPEIDTGVHTLLALRLAAKISNSETVRFAVLTHDLGKAATPKLLLPRHHGHEDRTLPILERLCERLPVPNRFRELAATRCPLSRLGAPRRGAASADDHEAHRRRRRAAATRTVRGIPAGLRGRRARPQGPRGTHRTTKPRSCGALCARPAASMRDACRPNASSKGARLGEALQAERLKAVKAALRD